jgi:phage terminase large subunit-like protein
VTVTRNRLYAPPDFPLDRYLAKLNHPAVGHPAWRKQATRMDPTLWALLYFAPHLRSQDTGNAVSLSEFHVAAAEAAKLWARNDLSPAELRLAWAAGRGSGKSTWFFLILLLWALAHNHRTFIVAFSHTGTMAKRHLLTLRAELAKNQKLRADYPKLCEAAKFGRRSVMDTQEGYLAASGAAIIVAGLDQGTLGIKLENRRPDLLLIDDGEPPDSNYSTYQKEQRLKTLREAVLPMSLNAPVQLVGTTTRYKSIMHDVLLREPWAVEENIQPRHFPALVTDDETGEERSAWPQRWPLGYLQSIRHQRSFAMNYQCQPMSADGTHWQPSDFTYDVKGVIARHIDARVLAIDPAVTSRKTSDQTGLAVIGWAGNVRKCLVERAMGVRLDPLKLRELVHRTLRNDPTIRVVIAEVNNGGEYITQALAPLPGGVRLIPASASGNKLARLTGLYDLYQRQAVIHAQPLGALEAQLLAHPGDHDDIMDSVEAGVTYLRNKYAPAIS